MPVPVLVRLVERPVLAQALELALQAWVRVLRVSEWVQELEQSWVLPQEVPSPQVQRRRSSLLARARWSWIQATGERTQEP